MFIGFKMATFNVFKPLLVLIFLTYTFSVKCQNPADKCEGKIDKCYCTDYVIDCDGHEFSDIEEIYPFVTADTFRISITNGKLKSIPSDLFEPVLNRISEDQLDRLTFLNLSGNGLQSVGKNAFHSMPNLGILDVSNNVLDVDLCNKLNIQNEFGKSLSELSVLKKLYLRKAFDKKSVAACDLGNLFDTVNMTHLELLDLSANGFSSAGQNFNNFLCDAYSLQHLNLSHNEFVDLVYDVCITNLVEYDFSYNKIEFLTAVETDEIESLPLLTTMKLGGNPFHCDCRLNDAYMWFNDTEQPMDFDNIICIFSENETLIGKPVMSVKLEDFCHMPEIVICYGPRGPIGVARTTAMFVVVAGVVLLVVTVISIAMCIRRRRRQALSGSNSVQQSESKSPAYSRMV